MLPLWSEWERNRKMDKSLKRDEQAILLLRKLYQNYGYQPYKMSRFEEYDLYVRNKDFLVSDQVITFSDRRGKLLALKPDVTLSIIKNAGKAADTQRVYYNENVYRVDPQTRAFREIMQTGLECIGNLSTLDVAEVVLLAAQSLAKLGNHFVLDISHMGLVGGILRNSGLSQESQELAMQYLHQKNSHELRRLCQQENCDDTMLMALVQSDGTPSVVFEKLLGCKTDPVLNSSLTQLQDICGVLEDFGFGANIRVDFSVGSDMKYYSGVVFKGYLEGITTWILSGGQYDKLLQKMGRSGNAVGFAIYLNLLEQIREKTQFDVDTVLLYDNAVPMKQVLDAAAALRKETNVLTVSKLPENARWRRLYKLQEGEAILVEDNG